MTIFHFARPMLIAVRLYENRWLYYGSRRRPPHSPPPKRKPKKEIRRHG